MLNPSQMIEQIMSNPQCANNPRAKKVLEALRNNDRQTLLDLGENIFRENGTSLEEAVNNFTRNRRF